MTTRRNITLLAVLAAIFWGTPQTTAQSPGVYPDLLPPEQHRDSLEAPAPPPPPDSLTVTYFTRLRTATTRRRPPIHPYFRDEYRVMQDLRRLVQFVAPGRIHYFESPQELVDIGNRLPFDKQAAIVQLAVAGGAAQILSAETNRQLRRRKIRFIRWDMERVILNRGYRNLFSLTFYKGVADDGLLVYLPKLNVYYSRYATQYYQIEGLTCRLTPKIALTYSAGAGQRIFTGTIAPHRDYWLYASYYPRLQLLNAYLELRSRTFLICRLYYARRLTQNAYPLFRGEMIVRL